MYIFDIFIFPTKSSIILIIYIMIYFMTFSMIMILPCIVYVEMYLQLSAIRHFYILYNSACTGAIFLFNSFVL